MTKLCVCVCAFFCELQFFQHFEHGKAGGTAHYQFHWSEEETEDESRFNGIQQTVAHSDNAHLLVIILITIVCLRENISCSPSSSISIISKRLALAKHEFNAVRFLCQHRVRAAGLPKYFIVTANGLLRRTYRELRGVTEIRGVIALFFDCYAVCWTDFNRENKTEKH